jgi:hypothetical protein
MATGLATSPPHDTAAARRAAGRSWLSTYVPFQAVVLPWVVARVIVVVAMRLPREPTQYRFGRLILLDGQWFQRIAVDWYDGPYVHGLSSEFPFFPLFPTLAGGLIKLGATPLQSEVSISWVASLVAIAGAHRLAVRHLPAAATPWATWFVALAPGAVTMVMGYSDSLYLAGVVWALVAAEDRRWWVAGLLAAVATASRPNGWIAVVALVVTVWTARAGWRAIAAVVAPSAAFIVGWCWYLWSVTGNPLVFYDAKSAWNEITFGALVGDPLAGRHSDALFHLLFVLALTVPYVMRVRRQPPAWAALVVLGVLPSLLLGLEGVARYAILAFPMPFAAADVLTSRRRWPAAVGLALSAGGMLALALLIVQRTWLP